jgi:hypothetical protein
LKSPISGTLTSVSATFSSLSAGSSVVLGPRDNQVDTERTEFTRSFTEKKFMRFAQAVVRTCHAAKQMAWGV